MLDTKLIVLLVTALILILILCYMGIAHIVLGKIPLEMTTQILSPGKKYHFNFKKSLFSVGSFEIIPKEDHQTLLKITEYYNGNRDYVIQSYISGLLVYSSNLKNAYFIIDTGEDE